MAVRGTGGLQIVIDPTEWFRLKEEADKFDPEIIRRLRRRIRNVGNVAAEAVKNELAKPSPDGGPNLGEGRAALIAATRVSVSFGKRAAGTRIVTGSQKLSEEHKGLLHVYNKTTFRHPVFGNREVWVAQKGRPYFGSVIRESINRHAIKEIRLALDEAVRAIGGTAL